MTDVIFDLRSQDRENKPTPWLTYLLVGLSGVLLGASATLLTIITTTNAQLLP